jgi:lysophospholipase L1-like esterase
MTREKPKGVVRVVVMGGSTVWGEDWNGQKIDNRDTIAAHLETTLNARASARGSKVRVQVINAGVVGYLLYQNLIYFDHYIARFAPDLVIAMDGHNDLDALLTGVQPYHHRNEPFFERAVNNPSFLDLLWWTLRYAENKSLFVRKASSNVSKMVNRWAVAKWYRGLGERRVTEPEIEEWLREYVTVIRRFDASVRIAGARVLFAVQPEALGERYKRLTSEEVRIQQDWSVYSWLHTTVRDQLIGRLKEIAHRNEIWFEDVSDVFKDEPAQVYLDYTHLTSRGAQVMARRLADLVESVVD